jgi:hypothetical protein
VEDFKIINSGRTLSADLELDIQVSFNLGQITFLSANEEYFSHNEIQLVAPNGCLRYEQGGAEIYWQAADRDPEFPDYTVLSVPGERISTERRKLQWHVIDNVSACLRGNFSSLCNGEDALNTLKSLLRIKATI